MFGVDDADFDLAFGLGLGFAGAVPSALSALRGLPRRRGVFSVPAAPLADSDLTGPFNCCGTGAGAAVDGCDCFGAGLLRFFGGASFSSSSCSCFVAVVKISATPIVEGNDIDIGAVVAAGVVVAAGRGWGC